MLQQRLRQSRVVREIGERDLGLDHPELGEVAAGVRVLGAEGRPERVDLGQPQAVGGLALRLGTDRLAVIHMHEFRADQRPNLIVLGRPVRCTDHEIYAEPKRLLKRLPRPPTRR